MHGFLSTAGSWISGLSYEDLPEDVRHRIRCQILSMAASVAAGSRTEAAKRVTEALGQGPPGPSTVLASGRKLGCEDALMINASHSMALDFDDYLFMGHTGHSAVLSALAVGEETDSSGREIVTAVAAANEVQGRLGGSTVLGPLNGQMWSFIHAAGAAAVASRLYGLDGGATASALALALSQPSFPVAAGFLGTEAKLLTASLPAGAGLCAARLARAGMKGPSYLMEHPHGFFRRFSFHPLPGMLAGLGSVWLTKTLAFKMHPGCAYFMAPIEAAVEVNEQVRRIYGVGLDLLTPDRVICRVPLLAAAVHRLSRSVAPFRPGRPPIPAEINFDLSATLASTFLCQGLDGDSFTSERLRRLEEPLAALLPRIEIRHHWPYTMDLLDSVAEAFGGRLPIQGLTSGKLLKLARSVADNYGGALPDAREWAGLLMALGPRAPGLLVKLLDRKRSPVADLTSLDPDRLLLPFSGQVEVHLPGGRRLEAFCRIHTGSPGSAGYPDVAEAKLKEEAGRLVDPARVERMAALVMDLPGTSARELGRALSLVLP